MHFPVLLCLLFLSYSIYCPCHDLFIILILLCLLSLSFFLLPSPSFFCYLLPLCPSLFFILFCHSLCPLLFFVLFCLSLFTFFVYLPCFYNTVVFKCNLQCQGSIGKRLLWSILAHGCVMPSYKILSYSQNMIGWW